MKQLFTFRPLHEQVAKTQPAMAEALGVFGDYIDAFDRSGISRAMRIASMHRFCDLFDLIMPESFPPARIHARLRGRPTIEGLACSAEEC